MALALQQVPINAIYSSPLQRAFITATIIQEKLNALPERDAPPLPPVIAHEQLLEIDLPLWEGLSRQARGW